MHTERSVCIWRNAKTSFGFECLVNIPKFVWFVNRKSVDEHTLVWTKLVRWECSQITERWSTSCQTMADLTVDTIEPNYLQILFQNLGHRYVDAFCRYFYCEYNLPELFFWTSITFLNLFWSPHRLTASSLPPIQISSESTCWTTVRSRRPISDRSS